MTTIYLMRHGLTDNPHQVFYGPKFKLAKRGRRQIKHLAEDMKQHGIRPTISRCSPFLRTQETCQIVNHILNCPDTHTDERLMEWNVGPWFNQPLKDFHAATKYNEAPARLEDPNVERLEDMAHRVIQVINEVRAAAAGASALLVSHREPLVSALLKLQGLAWNTIHTVDFPVATIWEITYDDNEKLTNLRKVFDHHKDR